MTIGSQSTRRRWFNTNYFTAIVTGMAGWAYLLGWAAVKLFNILLYSGLS
jgi:hypothetical protein